MPKRGGSTGFPCPACGKRASRVYNSRTNPSGIRRNRECLDCGSRFTTYERQDDDGVNDLPENIRDAALLYASIDRKKVRQAVLEIMRKLAEAR